MKVGFQLKAVSKSYSAGSEPALSQVSFELRRGENLAILGKSGCGKSTLLRILAGLDTPSSGQLYLDGSLLSEQDRILVPPYRRNVSMVFQDLALWPNLTVLENVRLPLVAQCLKKAEVQQRVTETLSLCQILDLRDRKPANISGGQQQRVALARALIQRPDFLFLDEPFSGLDLVTKTDLLADISKLSQAEGISIALVSHDPSEAMALCQRAIVLNQGQIEESGPFRELLNAPKSRIMQVFKEQLNAFGCR